MSDKPKEPLDLETVHARYRNRCVTCDGTGHYPEPGNPLPNGACQCCQGKGWWQGKVPTEVEDLLAEVERLKEALSTMGCAFCGATIARNDPAAAEKTRDHMLACKLHPLHQALQRSMQLTIITAWESGEVLTETATKLLGMTGEELSEAYRDILRAAEDVITMQEVKSDGSV